MRALPKPARKPRYPQPEPIGQPTVTVETVTPTQAADRILELLRWANQADELKWGDG